jgi:nucleoside-diphosphate-sugar epimerase
MKQAFITGVTGFIGGRFAEAAFERGIPIVGLVRNWAHATSLARLPVRMIAGDLMDPETLRKGMEGCDVVFHCAVDNRARGGAHRRSIVEGTRNVMQAALDSGVKRVVHLSSAAVYSYRPKPDAATEAGRCRRSGDAYCDSKIEAEEVALKFHRESGLPVTILRPTVVYGPFGYFSSHAAELIREGRMVLVDGGSGICNSLYVDNLVQAMFLAAERDAAVGEVFHVSDSEPVTWKVFIEGHGRALGEGYLPLPEMTQAQIRSARAKMVRDGGVLLMKGMLGVLRDPRIKTAITTLPMVGTMAEWAKEWVGRLPKKTQRRLKQLLGKGDGAASKSGGPQPLPMTQSDVQMFTVFSDVTFSIDKARRLLGYEPNISFARGMDRTAKWIKWARI